MVEELIVLEVPPEDVADKHRGWTGSISVGTLEKRSQYKVTCKSKYKLKNGVTRIKFVGTLIEEDKFSTAPDGRVHVSAFLSADAINMRTESASGSK